MSEKVRNAINLITGFKNIDELHHYISNELNLDDFTDEEFMTVWKHMNKFDK